MPIKGTHLKTPIIKLGRADLYEPRAFKPKKGEEEDDKKQSAPSYNVNLAFDKTEYKKFILDNKKAIQAAIDHAIEQGEWDEDVRGNISFKDADKDKVPESMTSKKKIILAEKRPALRGKFSISVKAKENRAPKVYYLDANGIQRPMPEPIVEPNPDDAAEVAESKRIKKFWDKMVFEGQYAVVSYTYYAWVSNLGQGVSARIDNVLIIGGGTPAGSVAFAEDFSTDDLSELAAWRKANTPNYHAGTDLWLQTPPPSETPAAANDDEDDGEDYDEETGEITPKKSTSKRRKPVHDDEDDGEETKPSSTRKATKRRKPVEPEPENDDDYENDDDDYDDVF